MKNLTKFLTFDNIACAVLAALGTSTIIGMFFCFNLAIEMSYK